jgi:uncharacterized protein YjlB
MPLKDQVKNFARKLIEPQPDDDQLRQALRKPNPRSFMFADDGIVPNHPRWPLIIHRRALTFPARVDQAAMIDRLFEQNGWGRSWRDSIYDFVHYHSQIHEVLGVARGDALVEFGGVKGKRLKIAAGDVAILPAGTGHRLLEASRTFLVVGAYPEDGTYDECTDSRDRPDAIKRIAKVKKPALDPVYGSNAGLRTLWKAR